MTSDDVENVLLASKMREKLVMAVEAMGLVPMCPVTLVSPVFLTPDLVRMANSPAVPRSTVASAT